MISVDEITPCFGQLAFFGGLERSEFRQCMARVALNLGGRSLEYPVDLTEIVRMLPWQDCQTVLALASLSASNSFHWTDFQEARLRLWADGQPARD